jgi:hypothetical protein
MKADKGEQIKKEKRVEQKKHMSLQIGKEY